MKEVLQNISVASVVVILLCTGIFFYTEWDLRRFKDSLPKAPRQTRPQEAVSAQQAENPLFDAQTTELASADTANTGDADSTETTFVEGTSPSIENEFDTFLDVYLEETAADAITSGDFTDGTEDAPYDDMPYDIAVVKAGFDDYNAYLATDPEYAYQRLDNAFREQFGEASDVDILIRTIRRSNEGIATINDAIENIEAFLRLASPISPEEGLQPIRVHLETLQELKQLAIEEGTELPTYQQNHIFDPSL